MTKPMFHSFHINTITREHTPFTHHRSPLRKPFNKWDTFTSSGSYTDQTSCHQTKRVAKNRNTSHTKASTDPTTTDPTPPQLPTGRLSVREAAPRRHLSPGCLRWTGWGGWRAVLSAPGAVSGGKRWPACFCLAKWKYGLVSVTRPGKHTAWNPNCIFVWLFFHHLKVVMLWFWHGREQKIQYGHRVLAAASNNK